MPFLYRRQDVVKELDLSEKQEEKLKEMAEKKAEATRELMSKTTEKRKALYEKAEAMLTETQRQRLIEKINALYKRPQAGQGRGGASKEAQK